MKVKLFTTVLFMTFLNLGLGIETISQNAFSIMENTTEGADEDILCSKLQPISSWHSKLLNDITIPAPNGSSLEEGPERVLYKGRGEKGRRRGRRKRRKTVDLQIMKPISELQGSATEYRVEITNHLSNDVKALLLFRPLNYTCGAGIISELIDSEWLNRTGNCFTKSESNLQPKMSKVFSYVLPDCGGCVKVSVHYAYKLNNETLITDPNHLNHLQRIICEHLEDISHRHSHPRKSNMRGNKFRRNRMRKHRGRNRWNRSRNRFGGKHSRRKMRKGYHNKLDYSEGINIRKSAHDNIENIYKNEENEFNDVEEDEEYDGSGEEEYSDESDESSEEDSSEEDETSEESEEDSSEEDEMSDESEEDEDEGSGEEEEEESDEDESDGKEDESNEDEDSEIEDMTEDEENEIEEMTEEEESEANEEKENNKNEQEIEGSATIKERKFPFYKRNHKRMHHKIKRRKYRQRIGKDGHFRGYRFCCIEGMKHRINIDSLHKSPSDENCNDIPTELQTLATENFKISATFCSDGFTYCCRERKSQHTHHGHPSLSIISLMHKNSHKEVIH